LDPPRRSALWQAKLRALVGGRWTISATAEPAGFPGGAALIDQEADRTWVLLADPAGIERRLGGAVAVALRAGTPKLDVLVDGDHGAPVLARRATCFAVPPTIWRVAGAGLEPVDAAPPTAEHAPPAEAELYRPLLLAAGLSPLVEGGVLTGEVLGLETARVVVDPDGGARVEAGVGRFDREAGSMMFAELGETDSLARAVEIVAQHRHPAAPSHPLNRLVPERWLRSVLLARPGLVGAATLEAVGSAVPRRNLLEAGIASAVGRDLQGDALAVTCATGVDLDAVVGAADDRLCHSPGARLVLVMPDADALGIIHDLAAALAAPAEVVTVPADWRELGAVPT